MIYAAKNKDDNDRLNSSSGGIFVLLARDIIKKGGVVFGASYVGTNVEHIEVTKEQDIIKLQKSKYVRSELKDSCIKTKEHLEDGKKVLFSGTPCQIRGLKAYLKKDYSNLLCVDFICHGIPMRKTYQKYIQDNNNGKLEPFANNGYMQDFLQNKNLEASCYNCQCKELKSGSDIKLSDFWGIENIKPSFSDNKGISAVFINTKKGEQHFNEIDHLIEKEKVTLEEATKYNTSYYNSAVRK